MTMEVQMVTPRYVVRDVDRHGVERYYYRPKRGRGARKIFLGYDPDLPGFWDAYAAAVEGRDPQAQLRPRAAPERPRRAKGEAALPAGPAPSTFGRLVLDYFADPLAFDGLDPKQTRDRARRILEACCAEPVEPGSALVVGDTPLAVFGPDHVAMLVERKRREGVKAAANQRHKDMRRMFHWAIEQRYQAAGVRLVVNPTIGVERVRYKTSGHHTWTPDEVRQFEARWPVGTTPRLALALFVWLGQRISDVHLLGRQHERDGLLHFTQAKNGARNPVTMKLPILPPLRAVIDATPTGDLAYLVSTRGRPFASAKSLGNTFKDWCVAAGLPHCSAHGLRKAAACVAADNGATEAQMMAIFGWRDTRMASLYIKAANRERLARGAMHTLLEERTLSEQNGPTFSQSGPERGRLDQVS